MLKQLKHITINRYNYLLYFKVFSETDSIEHLHIIHNLEVPEKILDKLNFTKKQNCSIKYVKKNIYPDIFNVSYYL